MEKLKKKLGYEKIFSKIISAQERHKDVSEKIEIIIIIIIISLYLVTIRT